LGHGKTLLDIYRDIAFDEMRDAIDPLDYFGPQPVQLSLFG
jgi:hypothetical protein